MGAPGWGFFDDFNARGWNLLRSGTCEFRPIVVIMLP